MGFKTNSPYLKRMAAAGQLIDRRTGKPVDAPSAPLSVLSEVLHRVALPVPPSTNNLFVTVGRRRVKSGEYRDWLAVVLPEVAKMKRPDRFPVRVIITLFGRPPAVNLRRDVANLEKPVGDALVEAGVLPDDNLNYVTETVQRFVRSEDGPGVWVEVQPV